VIIRTLGTLDYEKALTAMRDFTGQRSQNTEDELWILEHPPTYSMGLKTRTEHLPKNTPTIPLIQSDRGGQITYHGPGQIVTYALFDLSRMKLSVRETIRLLEKTTINLLSSLGIQAHGDAARPGVYVGQRKIASLGLKVRHGCSYHGVALNVDMDLKPFNEIETCGYPELDVTQLKDLNVNLPIKEVAQRWADQYLVSFSEPVVSG
jgi:lipoyl(octanoyl) transferase